MSGAVDATAALPDARPESWALRFAPPWAIPFVQLARWDRPAGWQLLLAPCWWSSALASLASGHGPNLYHLALFLIGAVAMRGAGCTYNDVLDRDLDAGVERTRGRPLPAGRVNLKEVAVFLALQLAVGAAVLFSLNGFSIVVGLGSLIVVAIYPLMKRVTSWPQAVLGLAFSYGAWMGWAAYYGSLSWVPAALYAGSICWTIGYDTIYAQQDARDDAIVGIRSTARLFGAHARLAIGSFYAAAAALIGLAVYGSGAGALGWLGWLGYAAHLAWQLKTMDPSDTPTALRLFRSNRDAGLLLFASLALNGWLG